MPAWQIHEYNPDLYILRQSGCTHYEKPFLYLIFGAQRALLVDTGAGKSDAAQVVSQLMAQRAAIRQQARMPLVVAHSHGHGDHTAGDTGFTSMPDVTLVPATVDAEQAKLAVGEGGLSDRRDYLAWTVLNIAVAEPKKAIDIDPASQAALVMLDEADGPKYRLGFNNFYVLTRYNRSRLYASAVWDLSQAIARADASPSTQ